MKVLFLDIDGVLNSHSYNGADRIALIEQPCVRELNRVLRATGAAIVLSSSWRYMIHNGAMTCKGFRILLQSHGVMLHGSSDVIAVTPPDGGSQDCRYAQCMLALKQLKDVESYAIVDDDETWFFEGKDDPCVVWTDGNQGLTRHDADRLITILGPNPFVSDTL